MNELANKPLLSDISNNILNCEVFKLMCSDGTFSTVVINQMAVDIFVNGKPVLFITTASANPNNEMLRRFPILELDETIDQTKMIKKRQAANAATGINSEYDPIFSKALGALKRVKVKVTFAPDLPELLPDSHIIMRTHFNRLLDYIKASAALHQYQREKDDQGYILASGDDYDNAVIPLKATTSNPIMIPLTKRQKMLLEVCKSKVKFSVKDIMPAVPFLVQSKLYEALDKLQEFGFLTSELIAIDSSKRDVRFYEYVPFEVTDLPKWEELCCRKKGIEGGEGSKGNEGKEGNDTSKSKTDNNNSLNSLNSQPQVTSDNFSWPNWNDQEIANHVCVKCQQPKACNFGIDGKPFCQQCGDWQGKEEDVPE